MTRNTLSDLELENRCRTLFAEKASLQDLIAFLRNSGRSKVLSIHILSRACGISRQESKILVHNSATWADVKKQHEELHDRLEDAIRHLPKEDK